MLYLWMMMPSFIGYLASFSSFCQPTTSSRTTLLLNLFLYPHHTIILLPFCGSHAFLCYVDPCHVDSFLAVHVYRWSSLGLGSILEPRIVPVNCLAGKLLFTSNLTMFHAMTNLLFDPTPYLTTYTKTTILGPSFFWLWFSACIP